MAAAIYKPHQRLNAARTYGECKRHLRPGPAQYLWSGPKVVPGDLISHSGEVPGDFTFR
jgi:hypothetical protein